MIINLSTSSVIINRTEYLSAQRKVVKDKSMEVSLWYASNKLQRIVS